MQAKTKILLGFLIVVGLGMTISASIFVIGSRVTQVTTALVEDKLPRLEGINGLYLGLVEVERLLYEYYATTDRQRILPLIDTINIEIHHHLMALEAAFADIEEVRNIRLNYQQVQRLASDLDTVLSSNNIDWDRARELLEQISQARRNVMPALNSVVDWVSGEAVMTGEETRKQTQLSTTLVVGFSVLILFIAAFVGYFVNSYIRDSAARKRLAMFAERNPNPILSLSWQGEPLYSNPACLSLMEAIGNHSMRPESLLPDGFDQRLLNLQKQGEIYDEWVQEDEKGNCIQYSLSLLRDVEACHLFLTDVTAQHKAKSRLRHQAYHDELTGLRNHRSFRENLVEQINKQHQDHPFALFLISVDRFSSITSSIGYLARDKVLRMVSDKLQHFLSSYSSQPLSHHLYRLDSSKFALIVETIPERDFALHLADNLVEAMRDPLNMDNNEFHLTFSVGIAMYPDQGKEAEVLLTNADAALARAQHEGGDTYLFYSEKIREAEQAWLAIERSLRDAIEKQQLRLHYQPKIHAESHRLVGVESLIRWQREDGSMVSPGEFIPVAEQSGLIVVIGEWVIHEAFRQYEQWSDQNINVAINLSARQFKHSDFIRMVSECLHHYAIDPGNIEFEITESLLMDDIHSSIETMHELKKMGFKLSIDDFGTGYSSLSYLKDFPIDKLKIDRAFIKDIQCQQDDVSLVKTIIDMAHNLQLDVVAEGVETEAQLNIIESLGCDEIQGFYFSKPVPSYTLEKNYFQAALSSSGSSL